MSYVHKVKQDESVHLRDYDPDESSGLKKEEGEALTLQLGQEIEELEELMYAAGTTGLLIVLQGIDTSGKDGTIRNLLRYVNVQSCRVVAFKVPTAQELAHDFLWRVHQHAPQKGGVAIFNRSHYEDVLVARVHDLVPKDVWKKRYDRINEFEKLIAQSDTLILKFFLHISKDEQKKRLIAREKDPVKAWKLSVGDWQERELWDDYTAAYEDALSQCSTPDAPWYIVPANHKWFRNLAITESIANALRPLRQSWMDQLEATGKKEKALLEEYRKQSESKK